MADKKKLDRWADKLLDTGKRNNLINFKDSKATTAEVLYPNCETVFSKCSVGHIFEVYDPKLSDDDPEDYADNTNESNAGPESRLSKEEYKSYCVPRLRNEKSIVVYAQTPNPITAVKNIAKKAKEMQDETGLNVAYLAFGFVRWNEKEGSDVYYRAPLLLVHVNILTGSILDPVKIEISDDDVVVNPTFDFLLQAEYGLSLPGYEDGESLNEYYSSVSDSVQKMGWEIIDECKLGIFSFLKINMYEDLKQNAEQILENSNVRALLGESVQVTDLFTDAGASMVVSNPLIDLHTVVDADSSQIEAIIMAKSGRSFVLQGPPGTGKSQTITNIIAECLHDKKKVLFVSEKQAALNVVYDKLKKAEIADFCLELHSHKANKKAVIEELNRCLELKKSSVSPNVQDEIRQKEDAQHKLDSYVTALHKKQKTIGKSLYQLFELYAALREYPDINFRIRNIQEKGPDSLIQAVTLLEQYEEYVPTVGQNYRQNEWYGFNDEQISYEERLSLKTDLEILLDGYRMLKETTEIIKDRYETSDLNYTETGKWRSILAFAAESDVVTPSILSEDALNFAYPYLSAMKESSSVIVPYRDRILERYNENIISELDGKGLYDKLVSQYSSVMPRLFSSDYKATVLKIQSYMKSAGKLRYKQAVDLAGDLAKLQAAIKTFEENESKVPGSVGRCYKGPDTDWDHVMSSLDSVKELFGEETRSWGSISRMSVECFTGSQADFRTDSDRLNSIIVSIEESKERIQPHYSQKVLDFDNNSYSYCIKKMEGCLNSFDKLGNWIEFLKLLKNLDDNGLSPYIDLAIARHTDADKIAGAFKKGFYNQWIEFLLFSVPVISSFSRIKQDQAVKNFVEKDNEQYEISKLQLKAELSQQRPSLELISGGSAASILRREGNKKRKQMSIRNLLSETGSLVQIIKPCFLMSPLSVSTFLDPKAVSFDTVIFDEASQIFPQDAIGAIYRGKQLIVVGDSRQMPPSNFFNSSMDIDDDDEEIGDINDYESILDICSAVFDYKSLAWHYRSHYEQLIAFSNRNFYKGNLVTFPSASKDRKGIGIDYYYVGGIFDRANKTNRAEAEFIVDLIFKNIKDYPERSLGVVAFSVAQQNMIDRLLSKRREDDPSFEWFFKSENAEPFFIKNLETVQGDERDTVIFSVAYAKDSQGRFIQNFGPLNRVGGERRLNVAVTRAKDNVQLVASIRYTDISLATTASEGVRLLRAYLDYAQNGEEALERNIDVSGDDRYDSDLEEEVCDFLRENGFAVDTQIGCSGYRIDMGLRRPDSSDYVLAVECDGATYHSSKNARDRDSLRQRVLENMGWQFYRIWSTDWYRNKAVEKERLLQAAKEALAKPERSDSGGSNKASQKAGAETSDVKERFVSELSESRLEFPRYRQLDAMQIIRENHYSLPPSVRKILETESPLSEDFLLKRIVSLFDREKVTKVVLEDFNRRMFGCEALGIIRKNGFLYLREARKIEFRVPGNKREIKHISVEELADGFHILITQNITATKEGLYRTMTNLLGFNRTGDAITSRFDEAVKKLIDDHAIKEEDGVITCLTKHPSIRSAIR